MEGARCFNLMDVMCVDFSKGQEAGPRFVSVLKILILRVGIELIRRAVGKPVFVFVNDTQISLAPELLEYARYLESADSLQCTHDD